MSKYKMVKVVHSVNTGENQIKMKPELLPYAIGHKNIWIEN